MGGSDSYFVMAATERYRMTLERNSGVACELFDLQEDPDELNNLVDDPGYESIRNDIVGTYIEPHLGGWPVG
jgi:hypothetical protein